MYILKIYLHKESKIKGFLIFKKDEKDWDLECRAERELDPTQGCSSMSRHDTYQKCIDHARRNMPEALFNKCF